MIQEQMRSSIFDRYLDPYMSRSTNVIDRGKTIANVNHGNLRLMIHPRIELRA